MWDPANPSDAVAPRIEPFAMAPVEEVYGKTSPNVGRNADVLVETAETLDRARSDDDPDTYADRFDTLIGGIATLEGGQVTEVVSFTTHDSVIVRLSTGDLEDVDLNDVQAIVPPVVVPDPAVLPETVDGLAPDAQLSLTLARLIIRAGCESVNGTGADVTPGVPPVGYLPVEPDLHNVIERAAGLAVGMLIEVFELDVDAILEWVGAVHDETDQGDQTTEVAREQEQPTEG